MDAHQNGSLTTKSSDPAQAARVLRAYREDTASLSPQEELRLSEFLDGSLSDGYDPVELDSLLDYAFTLRRSAETSRYLGGHANGKPERPKGYGQTVLQSIAIRRMEEAPALA